MSKKFSRREFLRTSGIVLGVTFLGKFSGGAHAEPSEPRWSLDYVAETTGVGIKEYVASLRKNGYTVKLTTTVGEKKILTIQRSGEKLFASMGSMVGHPYMRLSWAPNDAVFSLSEAEGHKCEVNLHARPDLPDRSHRWNIAGDGKLVEKYKVDIALVGAMANVLTQREQAISPSVAGLTSICCDGGWVTGYGSGLDLNTACNNATNDANNKCDNQFCWGCCQLSPYCDCTCIVFPGYFCQCSRAGERCSGC